MKGDPREMMLRTAVLEWQKKYGVQDGDPLLASLELFQIYLANLQTGDASGSGLSFQEFRESFELLDQRSKIFAKHAADLIEALRQVPNTGIIRHSLHIRATYEALLARCKKKKVALTCDKIAQGIPLSSLQNAASP
jgi:hypothetical protein